MPAAQELDGDALGMLVSCLCGTGSDQKVAARRVRPTMQQAAGLHNNTRLGLLGQKCQHHVPLNASTCAPAGVCSWPGTACHRTLSCAVSCVAATGPVEDNSLPQVPLQGGPALPQSAHALCCPSKIALLVLHPQVCTALLSTCTAHILRHTAHSLLVFGMLTCGTGTS